MKPNPELSAKAETMMRKATMHLVLHAPFYGALILRLKQGECRDGHPTIWTDGRALRYNPAFIAGRTFDDLCFILKHEITHCALAHPYRGARMADHDLANIAADHAVNLLLKGEGVPVPRDATCDSRFSGMAFEQIYALLESERQSQQQAQQQKQQQQQQQPDAGASGSGAASGEGEQQGQQEQQEATAGGEEKQGKQEQNNASSQSQQQGEEEGESKLSSAPGTSHGDFLPAGTSGEPREGNPSSNEEEDAATSAAKKEEAQQQGSEAMSEAEREEEQREWEAAVASAAMQAENAGHLSANALRAFRESFAPAQSYADQLHRFASRMMREETSWKRPSRRSAASGTYLPSLRNEAVGKLCVAIDTSGSINEDDLSRFEREVQQIHSDLRPEEIVVLFADARLRGEQRIGRYEECRFDREQCRGGGGTSFRPVFERVEEMESEGEEIVGVIYLTDLYCSRWPEREPESAVLWVSTSSMTSAPFGEVISMSQR